jgi:tetratricopeptide (TPR) repeat protein
VTRPLDKHLDRDELDALVSARGANITGGIQEQHLEEAERHVAACQDCAFQLQMLQAMQSDLTSPPPSVPSGPHCHEPSEWLRVAAGLLPTSETRERMKHASQCGHCGPLLKQAVASLAEEVTQREEALLSTLRSVEPDWQSRMARSLSLASEPVAAATGASRLRGAWPVPVFALAAIACAAVALYLGVRQLRGPSVDQLLAQAYTERRTLEVRIPHAQYAPLRVERGGNVSNLDKPPSLLKAEALIGEKLQTSPNDPVWLDASARADLLDGNYDSAVKTLQRALPAKPDSPRLLTDLGSAYYMRGQSTGDDHDYGRAIEQLGHALAKDPKDPIALFNSALACEQFLLFDQAQAHWKQYLRQDPRGPWAQEAREHLDKIQQTLEKREHANSQVLSESVFGAS